MAEPLGFYSVEGSIRIFLGADKENYVQKGVAGDVFASYTPDEDEGSKLTGAAGAITLITRRVNGFTLTLVFLPTATGIRALNILRKLGTAFPVNIVGGTGTDAERLQGRGVVQNTGPVEFSVGGSPRTVTIAVGATTYQMGPLGERFED